MQTRGAVIRKVPGEYEVIELDLDDPWGDEVEVEVAASGLCHSDDHMALGDIPLGMYPMAGGHEGAGIVTKAGPNTKGIREGDHVVFSFGPSCGYCRWCATGNQRLCDRGAHLLNGARFSDPASYRFHATDGTPVGQANGISTFAEHTVVSIESVVKIPSEIPLLSAALTGCAVSTGWGSAVNSAGTRPGNTVIVMGVGGIGINAVQGAAYAGASHVIAVDPVAFKREKALDLGATHAVATMEEATDLARQMTNGQGADSAIVAVGVTEPGHVAEAFGAIRKAGVCVVTGLGPSAASGLPISLAELTLWEKRIHGALYGGCNPTWDIPNLLRLYQEGHLKLDEIITRTYMLDEIAQGYRDMHAGINIRGVIDHQKEK
jgi:S-(hydroxymethyl)glutathione dehydrogenase/alcohol dehydrogenase